MAKKKRRFLCPKLRAVTEKRYPDFAIWGPARLDQDGEPLDIATLGKTINPHVVFQFSWGNKLRDEKLAMDDMSVYGGTGELLPLERPNVLFLIKAKREGDSHAGPDSSVYGFDVYVVRQGARMAENPTFTYRVGINEDVSVEVAPADMGLPAGGNPLVIPLSAIRSKLEGLGVVFEAEPE